MKEATLEDFARNQLRKNYPNLQSGAFKAALGNLLYAELIAGTTEEEAREDLADLKSETSLTPIADQVKAILKSFPDRRPDAFVVNDESVLVFEIEDTNTLSSEKLKDYALLWFGLDCYYIDLELFVADRYGLNLRRLDLCDLYYHFY